MSVAPVPEAVLEAIRAHLAAGLTPALEALQHLEPHLAELREQSARFQQLGEQFARAVKQ